MPWSCDYSGAGSAGNGLAVLVRLSCASRLLTISHRHANTETLPRLRRSETE